MAWRDDSTAQGGDCAAGDLRIPCPSCSRREWASRWPWARSGSWAGACAPGRRNGRAADADDRRRRRAADRVLHRRTATRDRCARLNFMRPEPGTSGRLWVNDLNGLLYIFDPATKQFTRTLTSTGGTTGRGSSTGCRSPRALRTA